MMPDSLLSNACPKGWKGNPGGKAARGWESEQDWICCLCFEWNVHREAATRSIVVIGMQNRVAWTCYIVGTCSLDSGSSHHFTTDIYTYNDDIL